MPGALHGLPRREKRLRGAHSQSRAILAQRRPKCFHTAAATGVTVFMARAAAGACQARARCATSGCGWLPPVSRRNSRTRDLVRARLTVSVWLKPDARRCTQPGSVSTRRRSARVQGAESSSWFPGTNAQGVPQTAPAIAKRSSAGGFAREGRKHAEECGGRG
jgi:hypothetical protein